MNPSLEDPKKRIAAAVNAAINGILAEGWSRNSLELWKSTIRNVLIEDTTHPTDAASYLEKYHRDLFENIRKNRGFLVKSVITGDISEGQTESPESFPDLKFEVILPSLSDALHRSIAVAHESAELFKESEILTCLDSFDKWANNIPKGGTNDKSHRASARSLRNNIKSTASWAKRFHIVHRTDFMSEAKHIFACNRGAIAGGWSLSKYPKCDLHGYLSAKLYFLRNSWAIQSGFVNTSSIKYFDEVPIPGVAGCCCRYEYIYDLMTLPDSIIVTTKERQSTQSKIEDIDRKTTSEPPKIRWWHRLFSK